jgi:pyruvate/2-oxoglutarate dehydrogenase complex dihydrolipoamide dehydrogenase (E3) component/uncharacterized membrane protein YdjX (TVP38/TMEM64 family)
MYDLDRFLTIRNLKSSQKELVSIFYAQPILFVSAFFFLYVSTAALSIPGSSVLTIASGALFGLPFGTCISAVAGTVGASMAFLAARFLGRKAIERRFNQRLLRINNGIEKEGVFYLFMLRLMPIFPFILVNLLMGVTKMRLSTFFWVSVLGMLPNTFIYVNAGTQLARIDSVSGLFSTKFIISLTLVGVFPWIAKFLFRFFAFWRNFKKFDAPKVFDYDLTIIGSSVAGFEAAHYALQNDARVCVIEPHDSEQSYHNEILIDFIDTQIEAKSFSSFEELSSSTKNFYEYRKNKYSFFDTHKNVVHHTSKQITIDNPFKIQLDESVISTRTIIVAPSKSSIFRDIPGLRDVAHYSLETFWKMPKLPNNLLLVGSNINSLIVLARAFSQLGSKVTIGNSQQKFLEHEEEELVAFVKSSFEKAGIAIINGFEPLLFSKQAERSFVDARIQGDSLLSFEFDAMILEPDNISLQNSIHLEKLSVLSTEGVPIVDDFLKTRIPTLFFAGTCVHSTSSYTEQKAQGKIASLNAIRSPLSLKKFIPRHPLVYITTSTPSARVGLTSKQALSKNISHKVIYAEFKELTYGAIKDKNNGFVKLLINPKNEKILGASIVHDQASALASEISLAMENKLTLSEIADRSFVHTSYSEIFELLNLKATNEYTRTPLSVFLWSKVTFWRQKSHV